MFALIVKEFGETHRKYADERTVDSGKCGGSRKADAKVFLQCQYLFGPSIKWNVGCNLSCVGNA